MTIVSRVVFSANGGTGTAPPPMLFDTTSPGTPVVAPPGESLSRAGFAFVGWNTAADGTGTHYSAGASLTPSANVTLYAQWSATQPTLAPTGGAAPWAAVVLAVALLAAGAWMLRREVVRREPSRGGLVPPRRS